MSMIGLSWMVISGSLLLVVLACIAVYWQVLLRREAVTALQICQSQLEQHMVASHQKDDEFRELSAGLRAEKAHVEQLQRQVEFAQQEAGRLRTEYRDQAAQLAEAQSAASAARAQYGQLLQQHEELKQASARLQEVYDVLQDCFADLTKEQKQQHFAEQQQLLKDTGDKKALVKDGVATLDLDERKAVMRPWLASLI